MKELSHIKELLNYYPDLGIFKWKIGRYGSKKGRMAGTTNKYGYIQIGVNNRQYLAHRLAWFYYYGCYPDNQIDHINRNKNDNRIENLRLASQQCNIRNTGIWKTNTSGVKGVCWDKSRNKWQARIKVSGKAKTLGRFNDFTEAVCHRLAAEQCLNWSQCDSTSLAHKYMKSIINIK